MALFFSGLIVDDESSGILFSHVWKEGEGSGIAPPLRRYGEILYTQRKRLSTKKIFKFGMLKPKNNENVLPVKNTATKYIFPVFSLYFDFYRP